MCRCLTRKNQADMVAERGEWESQLAEVAGALTGMITSYLEVEVAFPQ